MPVYRCFGLTDDNRILWGRHIEAENVTAAIVACTNVASKITSAFEIWRGSEKVYRTAAPRRERSDTPLSVVA
jgi:hypothetical protein